jgi:hypothetical protein
MEYFIFLKYVRSLEEFRKNPHVKIPPKSPCANFQILGIFKNLIFIRKGIFFRFQPIRSSPTHVGPLCPAGHWLPAQPTRPKLHWRMPKGVFSSTLRTPAETPSLSHVTALWGPPVSSIPFPMPADRCRFTSSAPATPRHPAPPSDAARAVTHPAIISPTPLNPAINAAVTCPDHPSPALPRPL